MRFTEGAYRARTGIKLHRAHSLFRAEISPDRVSALVPCREIRSLGDTTEGVNLHYVFSAPEANMISVKVFHFNGEQERGPRFSLQGDGVSLGVKEEDDSIMLTSGELTAVLSKKGDFSYDFFYKGKKLTGGGRQGTAYVTDLDYECDRKDDMDGRPKPSCKTETYVRETLELDVGEYIYGFGERFTPFVKNGQSLDVWNRDGNTSCHFAYKSIPFYLSSRKYGVLVNTPAKVDYEVGSLDVRHVEFSTPGEALEYIVIAGEDNREVLSRYTALTGRSAVPPAWTFGLWLTTSWILRTDAEKSIEFVNEMEKYDIPLEVFHFDARWMDDFKCCDFCWSERYGDVKSLLKFIHDKGVKVCMWINPYISQESHLFAEGRDKGYLLKRPDGAVWQTDTWMSGIGIVDFTNPAARDWYIGQLEALVDLGADCFKTDFGEKIPTEVVWHDGSDPAKMHNYYTFLYNKAVYEMLQRKKGKADAVVFARSATVGNQQFPVHWGGDNAASYVSMAETLRGGLSFCLSGFGFWAHDIGGFFGKATPDLYKRWVAFGLLSTHSRLHGNDSYRVPWVYDGESVDVLRHFVRLKYSLMPYLYAGAVRVNREGIPLMQPMMLAFPDDPTCLTLDRQYMLGDDLLVAPVFREDGQTEFYVPEGDWTDFQSGEVFTGPRWYKRTYDYFGLPVLVRPGAVLPVGAGKDSADYDYAEGVIFQVYGLEEGESRESRLYDREGREICCFEAVREKNSLALTLAGEARNWAVRLMGISEPGVVTGAKIKKENGRILLSPDQKEVKVTL